MENVMEIRSAAIARTKKFEGSMSHFYRDTKSKVTVGVGHLLSTAVSTDGIKMLRDVDDKLASKKEKIDEWSGVLNGTIGTGKTTLHMEGAEIDRLLGDDLAISASDLAKRFSNLDDYPDEAQDALLDMMFNLGLTKFSKANWPKLFAAVENKDWTSAADNCHRDDVQKDRNNEIKQLFRNAVSAAVAVPLRDIHMAASALIDHLASVMQTAAAEMDTNPKLFPGGINHIVVDAQAGSFSLKVELQGPEKAIDQLVGAKRDPLARAKTRTKRSETKAT
jgi:GH24 family phage-related lysozyme (muramidase)